MLSFVMFRSRAGLVLVPFRFLSGFLTGIWSCLGVQVRNPLDPFLNKLAREYVDDNDLTTKMHRYFQVEQGHLEPPVS